MSFYVYGRAVREGAGKPGRDTLPPNLEDSIGMLTPMIRVILLYNKSFVGHCPPIQGCPTFIDYWPNNLGLKPNKGPNSKNSYYLSLFYII